MIIIDGHQDLAWNIRTFERDYTRSVFETRCLEQGSETVALNGDTLLGWPDYIRGQVAFIFSTLFATPIRRQEGAWDKDVYATPQEANTIYRRQLETYYSLIEKHPDKYNLIQTCSNLEVVLAHWQRQDTVNHPVGLVLLMEGAEAIRSPDELEIWWQAGVRIIGLAWAGNRFCGGTREPGPLTREGFELLDSMAGYGFILDLSHMDEKAALQSLDHYTATIIASHSNANALLGGFRPAEIESQLSNRHFSDHVIHKIVERNGVIGVVPFNTYLVPDWKTTGGRSRVTLQHVVAQIDYICQLAGDAQHVAIGTDFDGGFGFQSIPVEIDTIADLQKLAPLLIEKGYHQVDIQSIFSDNWLRILRDSLPESI
jgi:membrane dipeptidase